MRVYASVRPRYSQKAFNMISLNTINVVMFSHLQKEISSCTTGINISEHVLFTAHAKRKALRISSLAIQELTHIHQLYENKTC